MDSWTRYPLNFTTVKSNTEEPMVCSQRFPTNIGLFIDEDSMAFLMAGDGRFDLVRSINLAGLFGALEVFAVFILESEVIIRLDPGLQGLAVPNLVV